MTLHIGGISNEEIAICAMLSVGYDNISEFRTHIQLHLSPQVPQD